MAEDARNMSGSISGAAKPAGDEQYKGEAIQRAGRALDCFSPSHPVWSASELAAETGTPKGTLRGILDTLVAHDMLRREAPDIYRLGFAWLSVGSLLQKQFDPRTVAVPLMRRIRDAINETVILSLRIGDQRVHIDYVESTHSMRRLMQVGSSGPLHVGATGHALLGAFSQNELAAYFDRAKAWLSPPVQKKLERDLVSIRRDGVAAAIGSVNAEMAAIAAAARLHTGECIAITISCPLERFAPELRQSCTTLLKEAVAELSVKVGARP
jgi:IclR family KDG regulon transcriptional repressor